MTLALVTGATSLLNIVVAGRILHFSIGQALRSVRTSLLAGSGLVLSGLATVQLMEAGPYAELAMLIGIGSAAYLAVAAAVDRALLAEIAELVRGRQPAGEVGP
jgi:hypothetical protein